MTRLLWMLAIAPAAFAQGQSLDLAPFARPCCAADRLSETTFFDYAHRPGFSQRADGAWALGLQWAEPRDIHEIVVRTAAPDALRQTRVEYWAHTWPQRPPTMPNTEDPEDDPWQGGWLKAAVALSCEQAVCRISFAPLAEPENPRAANLPGLRYRRTLKVRLVAPAGPRPEVTAVQVFSNTGVKPARLAIRFEGKPLNRAPSLQAYNGTIRDVQAGADRAVFTVDIAEPTLAGSNDVTVIQVRHGGDVFSFAPADVAKAPVYVPDFHAIITEARHTPAQPETLVRRGERIRERLAREPEQTYERASREIPPLDPVIRQGGRLYLPLAADASWQKFAFEWGGNISISKSGVKAKGGDLERLTWTGDRISWRLGTGATPDFRAPAAASNLKTLEDSLPVAIATWASGGIEYEEEGFATLLGGPLSPEDSGRQESTPAVAAVRLQIANGSGESRIADVWLGLEPGEALAFQSGLLTAGGGTSVRACVRLPQDASSKLDTYRAGSSDIPALHARIPVAGNGRATTFLLIPFIPGLTGAERARLTGLDYAAERDRVIQYWRGVTAHGTPFEVPEERFNTFARGLIPRIRISATKDANTGLYMVPAASYSYGIYADESSFQIRALDSLGHHPLAAAYLKTFVDLQGSKPFAGTYRGDQSAVYHGARVKGGHDYTTSDYNRDHGAVMIALARHFLLTRDRAWLAGVLPGMKRAGDWITAQRQFTKVRLAGGEPCPEYGLLPAGHLSDNDDWGHWFGVNAYASGGFSLLARVLRETGDPDAARYERDAAEYESDVRAALSRAAAAAPVVKLRDGTFVPYLPSRPHQRIRAWGPQLVGYYSRYGTNMLPTFRLAADRELLTGAQLLLETGVIRPEDAAARWMLDDWEDNTTMSEPLGINPHGMVEENYWFSRGGMVFQTNLYNPTRAYLRRGEAPAAVRTAYNSFVACYYPAVNVFTEEFRQWQSPSGPFYKVPDEAQFVDRLRDMLVFEDGDDLHLAAGAPQRWIEPGKKIAVRQAPTYFGPLSYELAGEGDAVRGWVELPSRNPVRTAWISVRTPEGRTITGVTIDGKPWTDVDKTTGRIRLPKAKGRIALSVALGPDRGVR